MERQQEGEGGCGGHAPYCGRFKTDGHCRARDFEESDLTADRMGRVCERLSIYMGQFFGVYSNMTEGELMEHRYARFENTNV